MSAVMYMVTVQTQNLLATTTRTDGDVSAALFGGKHWETQVVGNPDSRGAELDERGTCAARLSMEPWQHGFGSSEELGHQGQASTLAHEARGSQVPDGVQEHHRRHLGGLWPGDEGHGHDRWPQRRSQRPCGHEWQPWSSAAGHPGGQLMKKLDHIEQVLRVDSARQLHAERPGGPSRSGAQARQGDWLQWGSRGGRDR